MAYPCCHVRLFHVHFNSVCLCIIALYQLSDLTTYWHLNPRLQIDEVADRYSFMAKMLGASWID